MNPIEHENQQPGTTAWQNTSARIDGNRRSTDIEGFCGRTSVRAGETLEIFVSSTAPFTVDLYRMGFYGGTGARQMQRIGPIPGGKRDDPPIGELQLRECDWPLSVSFRIPTNWLSGVYLGQLTQVDTQSPTQSYVIFVLHDDRQCDFLFKTSDMSWCAYNAWPDEYSLYYFHGDPAKVGYWGPDLQVSFDRPYAMLPPWYAMDTPENCAWMVGASQFLILEFPLLFWMESRGYDVSYMSCLDLHDSSSVTLRKRAKALLATGHDEYWSVGMHDNLKGAVETWHDIPENGLSVAFFCGGSLTGVTGLEPSASHPDRPNRRIRRIGRWGPIEPWLLAIQPEQSGFTDTSFAEAGELMGARLADPATGVGDWICRNMEGRLARWFYDGTGLNGGDRIHDLIGPEFTGNPMHKQDLEVLAEGPMVDGNLHPTANLYTATLYPGPKGNFVFNASTMWWPQMLNASTPVPYPPGGEAKFFWGHAMVRDRGEMEKVERMTINLFDMFLNRGGTGEHAPESTAQRGIQNTGQTGITDGQSATTNQENPNEVITFLKWDSSTKVADTLWEHGTTLLRWRKQAAGNEQQPNDTLVEGHLTVVQGNSTIRVIARYRADEAGEIEALLSQTTLNPELEELLTRFLREARAQQVDLATVRLRVSRFTPQFTALGASDTSGNPVIPAGVTMGE